MARKLHIAVSSCSLPADAGRTTFNGRPLVYVEKGMVDWLLRGGVLPVLLPSLGPDATAADYEELLRPFDGVVLEGGVDMSPTSYGEVARDPEWLGDRERDIFEIALVHAAMSLNKPLLGVCRGHQVINVALGGTLFQDIETDVPGALRHRDAEIYERNRHEVEFPQHSMLDWVFGADGGLVNSVHHQAVKDLADGLAVLARSSEDKLIEAFQLPAKSTNDPWVVGVQWHPEFQDPADGELLPDQPLLHAFCDAIRARA